MNNAYGIFATSIASTRDHSIARLRNVVASDEQAERIVALAAVTVAMRTGEDASVVEAAIRESAEGLYIRARGAVKLASAALTEVSSAYATLTPIRGAGEGFEGNNPIHDCRNGGEVAEMVLTAA